MKKLSRAPHGQARSNGFAEFQQVLNGRNDTHVTDGVELKQFLLASQRNNPPIAEMASRMNTEAEATDTKLLAPNSRPQRSSRLPSSGDSSSCSGRSVASPGWFIRIPKQGPSVSRERALGSSGLGPHAAARIEHHRTPVKTEKQDLQTELQAAIML